jgi:hypothetical protein
MKRSGQFSQLLDEAWLRDQYETQGKTCPQIATEVGCTPAMVAYRANQHGIKLRGRHGGHWEPKLCERCGDEFTPSGPAAKYCSKECRLGTKACKHCGREFAALPPSKRQSRSGDLRSYDRQFCSQECFAAWKQLHASGRHINSEGYVVLDLDILQSQVNRAIEVLYNYAPESLAPDLLARIKADRQVPA